MSKIGTPIIRMATLADLRDAPGLEPVPQRLRTEKRNQNGAAWRAPVSSLVRLRCVWD